MNNHDKIFVIRRFRGTCSFVGMLKGYMVSERLGITAIYERLHTHKQTRLVYFKSFGSHSCMSTLTF